MDDSLERMLAKLSPEALRRSLVRAGLYLTAYELLKYQVVDQVESFFLGGGPEVREMLFANSPPEIAKSMKARYKTDVLSRHENKFHASCLWLLDMMAINDGQLQRLLAIRNHRNEVAHEIPKLLIDPNFSVRIELLEQAEHLIGVVSKFWARIAIDCDPQFDGQDIPDDEVKTGSSMLMGLILEACSDTPPTKAGE